MSEYDIVPDWFDEWFDTHFRDGRDIVTPSMLVRLGIRKDQIYTALSVGELEGFKPFGRWMIPRPALRTWLLKSHNLNF